MEKLLAVNEFHFPHFRGCTCLHIYYTYTLCTIKINDVGRGAIQCKQRKTIHLLIFHSICVLKVKFVSLSKSSFITSVNASIIPRVTLFFPQKMAPFIYLKFYYETFLTYRKFERTLWGTLINPPL